MPGSSKALFVCAGRGDLAGVTKELEAGATVDSKHGGYGYTALITAAENNHLDVVKYLVEVGKATVDFKSNNNTTALIEASCLDNVKIVKYLVEVGKANTNLRGGDEKKTPLEWAKRCSSKNVISYLSDLSASGTGDALFKAAKEGDLAGVVSELKANAPVDSKHGGYGVTALIAAAENNHLPVVKHLVLEGHAKVSMQTKSGTTALIEAACHDNLEIVKFLVEKGGADINYRGGDEKKNAMEWAEICGRKGTAEYLSKRKEQMEEKMIKSVKSQPESLDREAFEGLTEIGVIEWLKSVASKYDLKEESIKAIEAEELRGKDLLSLSQRELKDILGKVGRVRRLTESLARFKIKKTE